MSSFRRLKGEDDGEQIYSVVEVFPEQTVLNHFLKVSVCRDDDPGIRLYGLVGTDLFIGTFLQNPQEFGLGGQEVCRRSRQAA